MGGAVRDLPIYRPGSLGRGGHSSLPHTAKPKLVAGADGLAVFEINLQQLLAMNRAALLVFQRRDYLAGLHIKDFASRRICELAVHAEGDPAGLIAHR